MKKILRAVNVGLAAAIFIMVLFIPLVKSADEYLSFFGAAFGDYAYSRGAAAYLISAVIPSFLILAAAVFHLISGEKFCSDIISAAVSAGCLIYSCAMVIFYLSGVFEVGEIEASPAMLGIIPAVLCLGCIACTIWEMLLALKEQKNYREAILRQPTGDKTVCQPESESNYTGNSSIPQPAPQPQPNSQPVQQSQPNPQPVQQSQPNPQPVQQPQPNSQPAPQPQPIPQPVQQSQPIPPLVLIRQPIPPPVQQPQPNPQPVHQSASQSQPVLKCISGEYEGAEFPCDGVTIIGSDPGISNIIISGDRISDRHCTISYVRENQTYTITDGSLYGVFITPGGSRLPAHISISLPKGTVISLGNDENRFMLS